MGTSTKASPLIRRIPDETGELVTYLTGSSLRKIVGIHDSTLARWVKAGAVRVVGPISGKRNYSVADAARLKRLSPAQSQALGILRTPEDALRYGRAWQAGAAESTHPALHHREQWDDFDLCEVINLVLEGRSVGEIAIHLGRTYSAVEQVIYKLRLDGDIPPFDHGDDDGWWERAIALLTPAEVAAIRDGVG